MEANHVSVWSSVFAVNDIMGYKTLGELEFGVPSLCRAVLYFFNAIVVSILSHAQPATSNEIVVVDLRKHLLSESCSV